MIFGLPKIFAHALVGITGLHLITFTGKEYTPLENGEEIVEMTPRTGIKRITVLWDGEGKKKQ